MEKKQTYRILYIKTFVIYMYKSFIRPNPNRNLENFMKTQIALVFYNSHEWSCREWDEGGVLIDHDRFFQYK